MAAHQKKATTFILLIFGTFFSPGASTGHAKPCVCVTHKSLCTKPPTSTIGYYSTAAACLAPLGIAATAGPILGFLGFTAGGIASGSIGAWMMSMTGKVAAGSTVALLQSWGAAGLGMGAWGFAGTMVTTCMAIYFPSLLSKYSADPGCEKSTDFVCFFNEGYSGSTGYVSWKNTGKAHVDYPEGKKVTIEELYGSDLFKECDLQQ